VTFDVAFASDFKVGRTLRPLTDLERRVVAKSIVDYLQLSNWVDLARAARSKHVTDKLAKTAGIAIFGLCVE
jgi:hypothetical protein